MKSFHWFKTVFLAMNFTILHWPHKSYWLELEHPRVYEFHVMLSFFMINIKLIILCLIYDGLISSVCLGMCILTHLPLDKMASNSQATFSNVLLMKKVEF